MGSAPSGSTYVDLGEGIPLIAGAADYGATTPKPKKATTDPTRLTKFGDIILCVRATIGDLNWADGEYCLGRGVAGLRADQKSLDSKYLWYFLTSHKRELDKQANGSTFPQINREVIETIPVPLPPLTTQQHIARVLEQADQLRKQAQQMERELNQLAQSLFLEMFGSLRVPARGSKPAKFGDIYRIESKLVDPRLGMYRSLPHIGPERIEKRTGKILPYKTAEEDGLVSGKFLFTENEVIYSKIRPYLMKAAMPTFTGLCSADMYPLSPIDGVSTREFLWGALMSGDFKDYLECLPGRANIPKLNRQELAAFDIHVPPFQLQQEFTSRMIAINEHKDMALKKAKVVGELFDGLMQRAFNGELTAPTRKAA